MTALRLSRCRTGLALACGLAVIVQSGWAQRRFPEPDDSQQAERLRALGSRDYPVHDPSAIVKCKDRYWMFHTGRGVASAWSTNLVEWQPGPRVFTNAPDWVAEAVPENRRMYFWAPDVIKHEGRYLLYYSVSSFGKNTSAIALATNPTLDPEDPAYQWTDAGIVIQSSSSVDYNAIDPAVFRDVDGSLWLSFGSFWSGIKLIQLDPKTGKRVAPDSPVHALARYESIEAPCIHRHGDRYYLYVNWGLCCRGTNSTYEVRVGRSDKVTGPYLDMEGRDMLSSGGTKLLGTEGQMIGPGHASIFTEKGENWFGFHFYDANRRGASVYAIRLIRWAADGWPQLEVPTGK